MKEQVDKVFAVAGVVSFMASIGLLVTGDPTYAGEQGHHRCGRHRFGRFSEWSEPVNLGPMINSPYLDQHPGTTRHGLSLYFQSNRPEGGLGGLDIWVSRRATVDDPWGPPVNVRNVNSPFNDSLPNITPDGHALYITSPRPGGCGAGDLYMSTREDVEDDLGWSTPVNLGCSPNGPNTPDFEAGAAFLPCDELEYLFFQVEGADLGPYPGAPADCGGGDLAVSMRHRGDAHDDGDEQLRPWPVGTIIEALCSPLDDFRPAIRSDGLEIFFHSFRVGGFGRGDLYTSTRPSLQSDWSTPVNLGPRINTAADEGGAAISFDGKTLYFTSNRDGGFGDFDLYSITRTEMHQEKGDDDTN